LLLLRRMLLLLVMKMLLVLLLLLLLLQVSSFVMQDLTGGRCRFGKDANQLVLASSALKAYRR
jgi:hypothetical protein